MIHRVPLPQPTEAPQALDRRAFVRHRRRLEMFWQLIGVASAPDLTSAVVFDLSLTGVSILVDREFAAGTVLFLRLPSATMGWNSHLVRVMHCRQREDGRYQVGCGFVK